MSSHSATQCLYVSSTENFFSKLKSQCGKCHAALYVSIMGKYKAIYWQYFSIYFAFQSRHPVTLAFRKSILSSHIHACIPLLLIVSISQLVHRQFDIRNRPRIPVPDEDPYSNCNEIDSSGSSGFGASGIYGHIAREQHLMMQSHYPQMRREKPPKLPPRDNYGHHELHTGPMKVSQYWRFNSILILFHALGLFLMLLAWLRRNRWRRNTREASLKE